jgi:hypothetical protein
MRLLFIFLAFIFPFSFLPCDCPGFPPMEKKFFETANARQLVFKGKVLTVGECNELATANFEVQELYLGKTQKHIKAVFDCSSDCALNFSPGEEWIVYAEYVQVEKIKITFCSRSRKINMSNTQEADMFAYGVSTAEEITFLREKIGLKELTPEEVSRELLHKNKMPSAWDKVFLLGGSIVAMVIFLIVVKKFIK